MRKVYGHAGELKKYVISSLALLFASVILGVVPYIALSNLIKSFVYGNEIDVPYIAVICAVVFLGFTLKTLAMGLGLAHSHIAAYGILHNIRREKAQQMINHPLGDIEHNGVGKYKKGFVEDIDLLENLVAHMVPEGLPNVFIVIVTYILIFMLDYKLGFLSLAIILAGMLPMAMMMKVGMAKMPDYYASLDKLNDTVIEFVGVIWQL
ncbi:MAG: ABC transporter transmembrane domain-containing protein [Eubacteriales bacterium]